MTRLKLLSAGGFIDNGGFTEILNDLEWCGLAFDRAYLWHTDQFKKREVFVSVTGTRKAVHSVMATTEGVVHNAEWGEIQAEVLLDNLFEC